MNKKISEKVINRLTLYHCILQDYISKNNEYISSKQIATLLKIDDSQVRKDINLLNNSGKSRVGYYVKELKKSIETTLGFAKTKNAYIIGAGNLGMALAKYDNFISYGLNIISLFDNDRTKIGKSINGKEILNIKALPKISKSRDILDETQKNATGNTEENGPRPRRKNKIPEPDGRMAPRSRDCKIRNDS